MRVSSARRPLSVARARLGGGPARVSALATVAVLTSLLAGCAGEDEAAAPKASPTPIARLNTSALEVPRIEFCGLVPESAVSQALGGEPDDDATYGNGEEVTVPGVGADVVHEIGCSWSRDDGTTARAWIFARPVDAAFARKVIASGKERKGCRTVAGPSYGEPAATQVCRLPDGERRVRHSGLFDQTWLTCQLSSKTVDAEAGELRRRADRWCVEVVNAVNTAS